MGDLEWGTTLGEQKEACGSLTGSKMKKTCLVLLLSMFAFACNTGRKSDEKSALTNDMTLPGAPGVNPAGGVRDPSVKPVKPVLNTRGGVADDGVKPVNPTNGRVGTNDDGIKPLPNARTGGSDDSIRPKKP